MGRRCIALLAALCVGFAACGDDGESSQPEQAQGGQDAAESGDTTAPADTAVTGAAPTEGSDDAVVRIAYDLVAASSGGFSLDPAAGINANTTHMGVYHWIYGALMRPTPDGTLEPDLAEEVTVVDPTTIEVVMRDDLALSNGTPLTAETVKSVLERNLSLEPAEAGFEPAFYSLKSIEVSGPRTLVLSIPDGTAPSWYDTYLGSKETVIVPGGTNFDQPVGGGPYKLVRFAPEQQLVLEKNPEYWNAEAIEVPRIELVNAQSGTNAAPSALRAGQVDWVYVDYSQIDVVGSELEITATPREELLTLFHVCKAEPPFDDPRVRQALSYAIDRDAINEAIFGGDGEAAWSFFRKDDPLFDEELDGHYAYDPDRARQLLEEAGLAEGFEFDMIPIESGNVPEIVQIVQQQWADIGVTMNITPDANFVQSFWIERQVPMGAVPAVSGDPRGRLDYYNGDEVSNTCGYGDPELAGLAAELDALSNDSDEAAEVWADAQRLVVDDALAIFVLFRPSVTAFDGDKLANVAEAPYLIPVPDIWQLSVAS